MTVEKEWNSVWNFFSDTGRLFLLPVWSSFDLLKLFHLFFSTLNDIYLYQSMKNLNPNKITKPGTVLETTANVVLLIFPHWL